MSVQVYMGEGLETVTEQSMRRAAASGGSAGGQKRSSVDKSSALYQSCLDFEALFIEQMLGAMRTTVHKTGLLEGGMAEDIFEDMLYDEYAKSMARTAGFGLADSVYLYLTSAQQAAVEPVAAT